MVCGMLMNILELVGLVGRGPWFWLVWPFSLTLTNWKLKGDRHVVTSVRWYSTAYQYEDLGEDHSSRPQALSLTVSYAVNEGLGRNILQSVVIDSAMYLLMVNLPDINNIAMSLYNIKVEDTATIHCIVYIAVLSLLTPPSPSPQWCSNMSTG